MEAKKNGVQDRETEVRYKRANGVIETVTSAEEVWKFFSKRVKGETREVFYCLYLSQRNGIVCFEEVSVGISTGTLIDIKGIVRTAILLEAWLIIIRNLPRRSRKRADMDHDKEVVEACQF